MRIWRIAPHAFKARYGHPNGWRIEKHVRDWSLRGFPRGALGATEATAPKVWWEITRLYERASQARMIHSELTLRDARAWCDQYVWDRESQKVKRAC